MTAMCERPQHDCGYYERQVRRRDVQASSRLSPRCASTIAIAFAIVFKKGRLNVALTLEGAASYIVWANGSKLMEERLREATCGRSRDIRHDRDP